MEWVSLTLLLELVVTPGLENDSVQRELIQQFLMPLLTQACGQDDENTTLTLGPELGEHKTGFDGFSQTDFVRQDDPA